MFLPAFAFSMIFYERLERVVESERLKTFLTGVAAAVVGLIAVTAFQLGAAALSDTPSLPATAALFVGALAIVYAWNSRFSAPVVLAVGAAAGAVLLR